jgi:hypothetical protein
MTYELIKKNYDRKLWNKKMVAYAVLKGIITGAEFKAITGETIDMDKIIAADKEG